VLPVSREELERDYDALLARPTSDTDYIPRGMKSQYICKDGSKLPFESTRHVLRSATAPSSPPSRATSVRASRSRKRWRTWRSSTRSRPAQPQPVPGPPGAGDGARQAQRLAMAVLFIDLDRFKLVNDTLGTARATTC